MHCHRFGLLATAALALALPGQGPPALPLLEHVPADHANLLYLGDPMPPLENLLSSRELATALQRSPTLRTLLEEEGLRIEAFKLQLGMIRPFLPREVLVATPERTATDLARLAHAMMTGAHALALQRSGGDGEQAAELWKQCLDQLDRVQSPRAMVHLRAGDQRTGESWFETCAEAAAAWSEYPGVAVEETDDGLELRLKPAALFEWELESLRRMAGVEGRDPDPLAAIVAMEIRAHLRLTDDGALLLRLGDSDGERRSVDDLGPLWRAAPRPLLFTTWNIEGALELVEAAYDVWVEHSETPAEDWLWENLPEGAPLTILNLFEQILDVFPSGSMAIRVDQGLDIRQRMDIGGEMEFASQAECTALGLVPADAEVFITSSIVTPDVFLSAALETVRMELEEQMGKAMARGQDERAEVLSDVYDFLHERMQGLLDYVHGAESEVFEPGLAVVLGEGASVAELRVQDATDKSVAVWRPERLRLPALAMIGDPFTGDDGLGFADRLFAEVLVGFGVAGNDLRGEDMDLGLGVPTRVYGWHRFPLRDGHRLHARGEAVLHCCIVEGHVVLSTSTALTRRIIAQAGKGTRFHASPPDEVGRSRCRGADLAGLVEQAESWAGALADPDAGRLFRALGAGAPRDVTDVRTVLQVLAELARMLGDMEQVETWEGRWYGTHTRIDLGPK